MVDSMLHNESGHVRGPGESIAVRPFKPTSKKVTTTVENQGGRVTINWAVTDNEGTESEAHSLDLNQLLPHFSPQRALQQTATHLMGDDLDLTKDALALADKITDPQKHKGCDEALKKFGIPSLNALVKGLSADGPNANVFDGRNMAYGLANRNKVPAWVNGTGTPQAQTFLNHLFFNVDPTLNPPQARAIILIHEAVHQVGGFRDNAFGTSKSQSENSNTLSDLIIEKCFPVLKGKLGDIG